MKNTIQVPLPNINVLLPHLKEEQAFNEVTEIQYSAGGGKPCETGKYKKTERTYDSTTEGATA